MILSLPELINIIKKERSKGKHIVFTNGCFDIIHSGHIHLIKECKKYGEVLIVALNSDDSVRRLKGRGRPILTQEERSLIIDNIKGVDFVFIFDEDTPVEAIRKICPDVLVKGGDYSLKDIRGGGLVKSYGGRVVIVPYIKGKSTSKILREIHEILRESN